MNPDPNKKNAIDFLAMVRQDLEDISPSDTPYESIATPSCSRPEFDLLNSLAHPDMDYSEQLGRFKIIKRIGEGGFAKVFVARDPNLDREVALKVPKPHVLVSSEARSRFAREAKSAAILSHPNIVPVFESGSAGPICFIASEYCPGTDLRIWSASSKKKPTPRTVVEIVGQLADALQHAHRRGIIHRDLKPSNIIVVEGEEKITKRLRITDFGLARQVASDDTLTANGAIIGTPAYMSPEQAEGVSKVDHRTDVYSLGMILYELLTGKVPFKRSSHIASIAAVVNEPVPSPRQYNPRINADLEAICLKALEKEPDSRYDSAYEFKCDLDRWLDGHAVSVRPLGQAETFRRWTIRNPLIATAILFCLASLGIGFAFSFFQWKEAQANLAQSVQQRDRAERNVDQLHKTIVSVLETSLASLEKEVQLLPAQQEMLDQLIDAHIRLIEEEAEQVEITPATFDCYQRLARIYRNTDRQEKALEICQRAEKLLQSYRTDPVKRKELALSAADIVTQKGYVYGSLGEKQTELKCLYEAETLYLDAEKVVDREDWLLAGFDVYRNLGYSHHALDEFEQSRIAFEASSAKAVETLNLSPENELAQYNFAKSFSDLSHVHRDKDNWQVGLEYLERAEELFSIAEQQFLQAPENRDSEIDAEDFKYRLAYIRNEIGLYLGYRVKDYERAEGYFLRAINSLEELAAANPGYLTYHNRVSHAYSRLLRLYHDQNMFDEVLRLIPVAEKAHLSGMKTWAAQRIASDQVMRGKIWAYEYGDLTIAEEAFDRAVEILETSGEFDLSQDHMVKTLLAAHRERYLLFAKKGESEKSLEVTAEAYRIAVERALKYPEDRGEESALHFGKHYAERVFRQGKYGLAKTVLDMTAEACKNSAEAQYAIAHRWAQFDARQRDSGAGLKVWQTSRKRSLELLSRAIDLGFSDYKRLRAGRYFSKYHLLPEFEELCGRIKPENTTKAKKRKN